MDKSPKRRRGWLFAFEGIDGSGKTTQVRRAAERLRSRGLGVVELREPTDGPFGRRIRQLTDGKTQQPDAREQLELFLLDRQEDVENNILPALERGQIVLLDRYYFSTIAYQGALGLDTETIRQRNETFAPRPDLVLYFRIDVDEALRRIEHFRRGEMDLFERRGYLERVKAIFDEMARRFDFFRTIDARRDEQAVAQAVLDALLACMAVPRGPHSVSD